MNINIQRSKVFQRITKKDYIIMLMITCVYTIIAFRDLGSMNVPQSNVILRKGDVIEVEFDEKVSVDTVRYYSGWTMECKYAIKIASSKKGQWTYDSKKVKNEEGEIINENYMMRSAFTWSLWSLDKETKYIEIEALDLESVIQEIVFLDDENKIIQPKVVKVNGKKITELTDEQELFPGKSTFRNNPYFDEYIYAPTAYNFINGLSSAEWTHPPLGKWFISLGIRLFGMSPFGWRFVGTLFGVLMLPVMYILAKKLFNKTFYATLVCAMFSLDFMHFVQTRVAALDAFVTMFIILMYYFMYQYYETSFYDTKLIKTWMLLLGSGISMGLGIASKWTGCYAALGLAVIFFISVYRRTREYNVAKKDINGSSNGIEYAYIVKVYKPYLIKTLLFCILVFIVIPLIIYILSYIPFKQEGNMDASLMERLIQNQKDMFNFHSKPRQTNSMSSKWYTWPLVLHPVFYSSVILSATHKQGINAMGHPFIWWFGIVAFVYIVYRIINKKDRIALFICIGYLAQYLPWIFIKRMTFIYHYFTSVPFVVLMNVYMIMHFMGDKPSKKKKVYLLSYMLALVVVFIMFYPVLSGQTVSSFYVHNFLRWMDTWTLVS